MLACESCPSPWSFVFHLRIRPAEIRTLLTIIAVGSVASSCGPRHDQSLENELFETPDGVAVEMPEIVTEAWDRFCVITPYTPPDYAEEITGVAWSGFRDRGDAFNLLVFIQHDQLVRSALVTRRVDFDVPEPTCFPAAEANFVAAPRPDSPGFRLLLPAKDTSHAPQSGPESAT